MKPLAWLQVTSAAGSTVQKDDVTGILLQAPAGGYQTMQDYRPWQNQDVNRMIWPVVVCRSHSQLPSMRSMHRMRSTRWQGFLRSSCLSNIVPIRVLARAYILFIAKVQPLQLPKLVTQLWLHFWFACVLHTFNHCVHTRIRQIIAFMHVIFTTHTNKL
jgi:hypothetical protein